jgi:hypothetical protein
MPQWFLDSAPAVESGQESEGSCRTRSAFDGKSEDQTSGVLWVEELSRTTWRARELAVELLEKCEEVFGLGVSHAPWLHRSSVDAEWEAFNIAFLKALGDC